MNEVMKFCMVCGAVFMGLNNACKHAEKEHPERIESDGPEGIIDTVRVRMTHD